MKLFNKTNILLIYLLVLLSSSCQKNIPKPYGYYRIDLPENNYRSFSSLDYPYSFNLSTSAQIVEIPDNKDDKYWIDIYYPKLNGKIYCSYKQIKNNFQDISEDTREFVYKHTIKADEITEQVFENHKNKTYGILYRLEGNTASSMQFILTDSTQYIFRGALYFNSPPNRDSIAP